MADRLHRTPSNNNRDDAPSRNLAILAPIAIASLVVALVAAVPLSVYALFDSRTRTAAVPGADTSTNLVLPVSSDDARKQLEPCLTRERAAAGTNIPSDWDIVGAFNLPVTGTPKLAVGKRGDAPVVSGVNPPVPTVYVIGRQPKTGQIADCVVETSASGDYIARAGQFANPGLQGDLLPGHVVPNILMPAGGNVLISGLYAADVQSINVTSGGVSTKATLSNGAFVALVASADGGAAQLKLTALSHSGALLQTGSVADAPFFEHNCWRSESGDPVAVQTPLPTTVPFKPGCGVARPWAASLVRAHS